jgi:HK97 family phage major capsid protein
VVPQLLTLAQVAGPFGDSVRTASLVITQTADGELRLLGRRVLLTDGCPLLGQVGDLILAALPRYTIALRRDVRIETSLHLYFDTDQLAIRLTMRLDGQPEWQTPVTYADGVTKASCFVALAAR